MSYQEKAVGNQMYLVFAMALLLVYLVLAGQYESWYMPLSVVLSVPLALVGPVLVLTLLQIDNNLYTQIGIILLMALSPRTPSSSWKWPASAASRRATASLKRRSARRARGSGRLS